MNHTPLNHSKQIMALLAVAMSCPFVQANTAGFSSPSTAVGSSEFGVTYAGQNDINTRESARRQALAREAWQLLQDGRTSYTKGKYTEALAKYKEAWSRMPKAPATAQQQDFIVKSIDDASVAVAMEYTSFGRYDDAEQLLLEVLGRNPDNKLARRELKEMRDPIRHNPALTPAHVKDVEEVTRLLELAYGYLDLGKYDQSYKEFERVLIIDPYNIAAKRGQEAVSSRKSTFYQAAHDTIRAKALAEVDAMWVPKSSANLPDIAAAVDVENNISADIIRISEDLDSILIGSVSFEDTPMEDALDFLRGEARKKGVSINFTFKRAEAQAPIATSSSDDEDMDEDDTDSEPVTVEASASSESIIKNLKAQNMTAKELLDEMCKASNCQFRIENKVVRVYQTGADSNLMEVRKWKVPTSFFSTEGSGSDDSGDGFEEESSAPSSKINPAEALSQCGVKAPQGSSANYSRQTGVLTVRNTPDNIDMINEAIIDFRGKQPGMVKVQAKFVEITQTNDEELSFDWVVNPFSINSGSTYIGGTNSSGSNPDREAGDFVRSGGNAFGNKYDGDGAWPVGGASSDTVNGLMTGGLRSGSGAVSGDRLNNLISSGSASSASNSSVAPGILSLSGIFDSGSYQMIMRGLSQKKGVDVMSAPTLVARPVELEFESPIDPITQNDSGDQGAAKIEVVRRFIYPTEYEAPTIQSGGGSNNNNDDNNNNGGSYSSSGFPVASPANPSAWTVEQVGIMLRFLVEEGEDKNVINFKRFEIQIVDFEGFINYGSPITAGIAAGDEIEQVLLTENRIDMPIFSRRYINSNPCIYDGHTIAIGGLIEDQVQRIEDKVPIFGDLPLVGRFFRSNAESHVRKNLIVFVTAERIDPSGKSASSSKAAAGGESISTSAPSIFPEDGLATP